MDHCSELSENESFGEGMPSEDSCSSPSLPRKLLEYITEVHKRSGVKLDVTGAHAASIELELDAQKQSCVEQKAEEMDMFSRPRSRTSGFQATSPLAIAQRKNAAAALQRPKSAYLLNGHCELNSSDKDPYMHEGYHTDGEEGHQVCSPGYQQTINHYRRIYNPPMSNNLVDSHQCYSSASSICSSEDEDIPDNWLSFRKSQSDIGTMRVQSVPQNNELLEKIKMLEKQNEMLKQQVEDKTVKDEATQAQHYSVAPIQPIRGKQLAPLKFQQQLEDMEGIDSGSQVYHLFMDAERTYVNGLLTLVRQFFLPMKMFSACRPHVLPLLQLDAIFLNCEQLMWYHQSLFSAMLRIDQSTDAQVSSDFLNTLDKLLPGLTVYTPFLALGHQTFQHELRSTLQNAELSQLVTHCEELSGTSLEELFFNIFQRFDRYKNLLVLFLRLPESNEPREAQVCNMIDYIKALSKEMTGELCDWNVMTAKMRVLQSITDTSMLPVEIFDTNVHYIKQGNLLHVVDDIEKSCVCLLFTTHVALANKTTDYKIEILNPGMMALCGATLYDRVDITGHPLQEDFQTGLRQDQLGFKIQFHNKQGIYLRVSKPSHLREWLQQFSEAIDYAHKNCSCNAKDKSVGAGIDFGPRIAAASLEKLFQQLTNPVNTNKEFQGTFFMTYQLFTTAEDVLTALINCLLHKSDVSKSRFSDDWEVFSYHSSAANSEDEGDEIVCSPSMDTLESYNSNILANYLSEQESPTNSTHGSPDAARKTFVTRPSPQRNKKGSKSSEEPVDAFVTARGTVKSKRRFSHDDGTSDANKLIIRKPSLVRANSDGNIVHNVLPQHSQQLTSDDSSNSLSSYQHVAPTGTLTPPVVSVSSSDGDVVVTAEGKMNEQSTSNMSRSVSTASENYGDLESEGEVVITTDMSCPTPKVSIQLPVPLVGEDSTPVVSINTSNNNCGTLVSEILEQFPALLESNLSQRIDFSHSLPGNLNMVGLDQLNNEKLTVLRSHSITGSVESVTASSWLATMVTEVRTLSEIHEDSAESRASTKSPSPPPADRTLRSTSASMSKLSDVKITKLESKKSDSFDRKMAAAHEGEQVRVRSNENGRRGSFLARFLPMRVKSKRHQSESEIHSSSNSRQSLVQSHPIPVRPTSPTFESSLPATLKPSPKKTRFPSVLRRKKDVAGTSLSPSRDFSMSAGRLSPSPGARYSNTIMHQRNILRSIYNNLDYWIHQFKEDFIYDKGLKDRLLLFLNDHLHKVAVHDQEQMEIIEDIIYKLKELRSSSDMIADKSLSNMLQRTIQFDYTEEVLSWVDMTAQPLSNATIVNLNPKQLARQLILLEYALYAAIERRELIGCCWKHKNKETKASNVCRVIKHSNKLTSWVMTAIIQQDNVQGRAAAIELFIKVASECLKQNDAQSCVLISCALSSCCVRHDRLKLSWEQVSSKVRQKYDKLVKFSNPDRRCRNMRVHLEKQQPPGVPYTGGYLEHLWAIDNGQNTYTPEGLVNFAKMTALSTAVRSFLRFQTNSYSFEPDFKLMHYIMAAERLDDEQLYYLSKQREP